MGLRRGLVAGAGLVAAVAMAASADTLAAIGTAVGWGEVMRWSLPVSVDVLALVAGLCWLAGGVPEAARRLGHRLTIVSVVGSVVLNAVSHLVETGHVTVGPGLVIAVSAVPPLAAALAVHLAATTAQGEEAPETDTPAVSPTAVTDTATPEHAETDTPAVPFDTEGDTVDTPAVPECAAPVDAVMPGDYADMADGTNDTGIVPEPGGRLSDAELDAVVVVLVGETDPPRSYNALEGRFRECGYSASAARLRGAWKRATEVSVN